VLEPGASTNVGVAKKMDYTTSRVDPATGTRTSTRETYYQNEETWLYANYVAYLQTTGHKPLANRRFDRDLHDFLVLQCKVTEVQHTDDRNGSRFHGVRLRTAQDDASDEPLLLERVRSEDIPF